MITVAALTEERHSRQLYEVTGPRLLSFDEAAGELFAATGQLVRYLCLFALRLANRGRGLFWRKRPVGYLCKTDRYRRFIVNLHACASTKVKPMGQLKDDVMGSDSNRNAQEQLTEAGNGDSVEKPADQLFRFHFGLAVYTPTAFALVDAVLWA